MKTSKKPLTNEKKLKNLISENGPTLNALLIERIVKIMEITEADIKEHPEDWERSIIHPNLWHQLNENVQKCLNS